MLTSCEETALEEYEQRTSQVLVKNTQELIEPEEIGIQVFEILKNITTSSKKEFYGNYISIESLHEMCKNKGLLTDNRAREVFSEMTSKEWEEHLEKDYINIKRTGGTNGIKWKDIEYLDYVYRLDKKLGITEVYGEMFFQFKNENYSIISRSLFYQNKYQINRIYPPKKH